VDATTAFSYLAGLLNRMTIPAIAAATRLIRCVKKHLACERRIFLLCH